MKKTLFIALALSAVISSHLFAQSTPLHEAAESGNVAELTRLIEAGADVNAQNKFGMTPLHAVIPFPLNNS